MDALATTIATLEVVCLTLLWTRTGSVATARLGGWAAQVGIVLIADPIGAGLALLVAVLVLAVVVYSWRYFEEPAGERAGIFPALLLLFEAGMAGFALTGDLFNAFVFFELMGAAAYALTGYRIEDPRPLQGALTFGIVDWVEAIVRARHGPVSRQNSSASRYGPVTSPTSRMRADGCSVNCSGPSCSSWPVAEPRS